MQTTSPGQDQIAQRAHELWEQEGRPEGRALEHWLAAENQLRSEPEHRSATTTQQQGGVRDPGQQRRTNPVPVQNRNGQKNRAKGPEKTIA